MLFWRHNLSILRFAHYEFVTELTGCRQRNFRFVLEDIKTRFSGLELHLFFSALGWITNTSTAATRKTDAWVCKASVFWFLRPAKPWCTMDRVEFQVCPKVPNLNDILHQKREFLMGFMELRQLSLFASYILCTKKMEVLYITHWKKNEKEILK